MAKRKIRQVVMEKKYQIVLRRVYFSRLGYKPYQKRECQNCQKMRYSRQSTWELVWCHHRKCITINVSPQRHIAINKKSTKEFFEVPWYKLKYTYQVLCYYQFHMKEDCFCEYLTTEHSSYILYFIPLTWHGPLVQPKSFFFVLMCQKHRLETGSMYNMRDLFSGESTSVRHMTTQRKRKALSFNVKYIIHPFFLLQWSTGNTCGPRGVGTL